MSTLCLPKPSVTEEVAALSCRGASYATTFTLKMECWDEIAAAFAGAAQCELRQSWRADEEDRFRPATVSTAWTPNALWVLAQMHGDDIFNAATGLNQLTCDLGDVFEMFLRDERRSEYYELHVTPENQRLQLRIERDDSIRLDESQIFYLHDDDVFESRTHFWPDGEGWSVLACVPSILITGGPALTAGDSWRFSFSRYDFTRGVSQPIISSSSQHAIPNFHHRHEWGRLHFV